MAFLLFRAFRLTLRRCLPRVTLSGSLLTLALVLFALDHTFGEMTWGALALTAGVLLIKGNPSPRGGLPPR